MELDIRNATPLIETVFNEAESELPDRLDPESPAGAAWVAKRMLEILERGRSSAQTIQALLVSWINNGELGRLWMAHENNYPTLRDFLNDVGTEHEGTKLSVSVISDMLAVAEVIVPYCVEHEIDTSGFFVSGVWSRLRASVPALRRAILSNDEDSVVEIVEDTKRMPVAAIRAKNRQRKVEHFAVGDMVTYNGNRIVVLVVNPASWKAIKHRMSGMVEWSPRAAIKGFDGDEVELAVSVAK